jgi:hypothetical protein
VERPASIDRRFCARPGNFGATLAAFVGAPPGPSPLPQFDLRATRANVGAGLLAKNDDTVYRQNSKVLDNVTCRESPIDTKNRLAAEV